MFSISRLVRSAPAAVIFCGLLAACQSNAPTQSKQLSLAATSESIRKSQSENSASLRERMQERKIEFAKAREERRQRIKERIEARKQNTGGKKQTSRVMRNHPEEGSVWTRYQRRNNLSVRDTKKIHEPKSGAQGQYSKLIAKYAREHGVPYQLARAVVQVESSFRANATGAAGEIGLMQIKFATARGMGYKGSRKALYNPSTNLYWGMKYLGKAHQLAGGSTCGTILKYNAGHAAKKMNRVSSRYCGRVSKILA
ncbi:MAG: lytic transglycosylase domain-containing protein [Rhizobiaceae bacterium]